MTGSLYAVTLAAALGCGLAAGVFFAFSAFVMPAVDDLPAASAIEAMQSINRAAVTPAFMVALFGTALAVGGLAVTTLVAGDGPDPYILVGSALYLVGTIGLTAVHHVPLNDALAAAHPATAAEAAARWKEYMNDWALWNHVRAATTLGAAAVFTVALRGG